jgi:hypothetical protein
MTVLDDELKRRLLFILKRGLIEARLLAQAKRTQQICDLSDGLEQLPSWLNAWDEQHLEELRSNLETYRNKYPDSFSYLDFLDRYEPPPF